MVFSTAYGRGDELSWGSIKGFSFQVLTGRWFMMFSSFMLMSVSGASYMFSLFSQDIKLVLGYDQSTLNLLSFFQELGANIGIHAGLIYEVTPPWFILAIGGVLNFAGYFLIWLVVTSKIAKPHVWQMCFYLFIGANSHCATNTGALVTSVMNFPISRGVVLGLLTGYTGLSAVIITQLYYALYGDDSKFLIFLMAWLPIAAVFLFLPVIRIHKTVQQPNDTKVLYRFLYLTLVLAGFLMFVTLVQQFFTFSQFEYQITTTVMLLLLVLPLSVVIVEEHKIWKSKLENINREDSQKLLENYPNIATENPYQEKSSQAPQEEISFWENIFNPPERGEDHTILQASFSLDMVLLLLTSICSLGSNVTMINNLSQIGISLGYPSHTVTTFVSLTSIWIYLGKVVQGVVSEFIILKYRVPRPLMLTSLLLLSCVGHLLVAFNFPNGLYVASIVIGFCYGANWPLIYSVISELFGLKHYSTLYNLGSLAGPIGSYLLGVRVAGYLYDKEAMRQIEAMGKKTSPGEELNCNGEECFKLAFIITTAVSLFGALLSLILVFRTKQLYRSDLYKKYKEAKTDETETGVLQQD
ncbi:protein NUCLEAR FUSION DEFECTIVE 4 isoform X1 [Vigna radiata var. radiata]|uniref:Protein NUCLEAR FUSION DEFECTIVE 4 isoform X1 n=1 Tax=Vigna radiata var. radiata TaxID=3916 RepID=A0A3Q0FCX0_VIGRR|nr:protein NUCLEAR FUSION DEFECTIVE 4 isoform X1 [Vigna radiata var. radiata]